MNSFDIILLRHLPTEFNNNGKHMGKDFDIDIVAKNKNVIRREAKFLMDNYNLGKVKYYSSPAKRCLQTLELLFENANLIDIKVIKKNKLLETDMGEFTGLKWPQIKKKYRRKYDLWINTPSKLKFPNGESFIEVQIRAWKVLNSILEENRRSQDLLICTHVDVIKMVVFKLLGVSIDYKKRVILPCNSLTLINHSEMGLRIKSLNALVA